MLSQTDGKKWLILSLVLKNFSYSIKQKMSAGFHIEKHSQYQNCTFCGIIENPFLNKQLSCAKLTIGTH